MQRYLGDSLHADPVALANEDALAPSRDAIRFARIAALIAAFGWGLVWLSGFVPRHELDEAGELVLVLGHVMLAVSWFGLDRYGHRSLAMGIASFLIAGGAVAGLVAHAHVFLFFAMIAAGGCALPLRHMPVVRFFAVASSVAMAGIFVAGSPGVALGLVFTGVACAIIVALATIGEFPDTARSA